MIWWEKTVPFMVVGSTESKLSLFKIPAVGASDSKHTKKNSSTGMASFSFKDKRDGRLGKD